jgi:hypothetical protein
MLAPQLCPFFILFSTLSLTHILTPIEVMLISFKGQKNTKVTTKNSNYVGIPKKSPKKRPNEIH